MPGTIAKRGNKWEVRLGAMNYDLGRFDTIEDAMEAANLAIYLDPKRRKKTYNPPGAPTNVTVEKISAFLDKLPTMLRGARKAYRYFASLVGLDGHSCSSAEIATRLLRAKQIELQVTEAKRLRIAPAEVVPLSAITAVAPAPEMSLTHAHVSSEQMFAGFSVDAHLLTTASFTLVHQTQTLTFGSFAQHTPVQPYYVPDTELTQEDVDTLIEYGLRM